MNANESIKMQPRFLWFLTLFYVVVILLANWFDVRLIRIFNFVTDAGTIIFPLTFILSDLITEVYGYKNARRAIWCGFLFNGLFILYGQLIIHLPSPHYSNRNRDFDILLAMNIRIIIASTISYFCAEPLNSFLMAKLKIIMRGHYMGIRLVSSTLVAAGVDSFIFGTLAFYHIMSNANLAMFILTMWLIKVVMELLGLPFSVRLAAKLKQLEAMDIYDWHTKYNLFSLNTRYVNQDNAYSS